MTVKRINKRVARKLFDEDKEFWIVPRLQDPLRWGNLINFKGAANYYDSYISFDALVNAFEYYNCDNERGAYSAFYIEVKEG